MSEAAVSPWTRMEIVQAASDSVTEAGAKYGKFRDTVTGKMFATIDATMVFIQDYRVLFGSNRMGDTPKCQSLNGIIPAPFVIKPVAPNCLTCSESVWANGERPNCKEKRILYFIDNKTMTPYDMVLPGTSVTVTKVFKARIDNAITRKTLQGVRLKMWDFKVTLALIDGKNGGKHKVMDYRNILQRKDAGKNEALTEFAQLALPQQVAA